MKTNDFHPVGTPGHDITARNLYTGVHGTCDLYTCSCGTSRIIERLPLGSYLKSPWMPKESK